MKKGTRAFLQSSFEVVKPEIVLYIRFSLALSIISTVGALLFVIGIFFTVPLNLCAIAVAYKDVFGIENASSKAESAKEKPAEKKTEEKASKEEETEKKNN